MSKLDEIKSPVAQEMKDFQNNFKNSIHSDVSIINLISNYVLKRKGKQMRPLFVFLSAKLVGKVTESTHTAASLIELMHTATLVHDDVVDESYERRGMFSVNAIWKSKYSVLLGDFYLAKGLYLASSKNDHKLLDIVSNTVIDMSEGELLQLQKSRKMSIDTQSYYKVIRKKTASLIATCTASGGLSAGATEQQVKELYDMGIAIGMAFQIKDDLFDYEPRGNIGKPIGNDLKEKKLTLPLIYALENSSATERHKIRRMIRNGKMDNTKITHIVDFVKSKGGIDFARAKMYDYKKEAEDILFSFAPSESRNSLQSLIDFTVERKK